MVRNLLLVGHLLGGHGTTRMSWRSTRSHELVKHVLVGSLLVTLCNAPARWCVIGWRNTTVAGVVLLRLLLLLLYLPLHSWERVEVVNKSSTFRCRLWFLSAKESGGAGSSRYRPSRLDWPRAGWRDRCACRSESWSSCIGLELGCLGIKPGGNGRSRSVYA